MHRTRSILAVFIAIGFLFPAVAFASDVDKCFKSLDKSTAKIAKELGGWTTKTYTKKSKGLGTILEKGWKKTAGCLAKKYKPKGAKKSDLKTALMRGKKVYAATNGEDWMGQGLINKCIPMVLDIYQGTEATMNKADFKKLSKKAKKKEKKNLMKNQRKIVKNTVGHCFEKENNRYKKRLEKYLEDNYEHK
jgi:uncharacterized protein YoxC